MPSAKKSVMVLVACLGAVACNYLQRYRISSPSMAGTLNMGDMIRIERASSYQHGDIVAFRHEDTLNGKELWVFRIVAVSGDSLETRGGQVFVNDKPVRDPPLCMYSYAVALKKPLRNDSNDHTFWMPTGAHGEGITYIAFLTKLQADSTARDPNTVQITKSIMDPSVYAYPAELMRTNGWSPDYFGPIDIPSPGSTVEITDRNRGLFKAVGFKGNRGVVTETLYFLMGDNRHNAADSRFIGLIPESAIRGLAVKL